MAHVICKGFPVTLPRALLSCSALHLSDLSECSPVSQSCLWTQTPRQTDFHKSASESSSSSPCSDPPHHTQTRPRVPLSPGAPLLLLSLALSQRPVQPETETNLRPEHNEIISYSMMAEHLLKRAPDPACRSPDTNRALQVPSQNPTLA